MEFKTEVKNIPETTRRYIVARVVSSELWYWGTWDSKEQAEEVARTIDGIVLERMD